MTAFARCTQHAEWGEITWELRSVNHRFLEVSARLPEDIRRLEPQLRERLGEKLNRGRVECFVRISRAAAAESAPELNETMARHVLDLSRRLAHMSAEIGELQTIDVLRWPGVVQVPEVDAERLDRDVLSVLDEAVAELVATREREGGKLVQAMTERLDAVERLLAELRPVLPELVEGYRRRLRERIAELGQQVEEGRIEQEVALFASRADVHEEVDRLAVHAGEARRVLDEGGAVGRRLDFLMQELHREANTLGSKAADTRLSNASVELKVLIEQMREQVQNIE